MSNLLTNAERTAFTSVINNHFDTFKRDIIIYIEPKHNFNNTSSQSYMPGYQAAATAKPAYTIQSQTHSALVIFGDFNTSRSALTGKDTQSGLVKIKVKQATRDYIFNNKVVKITIDGDSFNVVSSGRRANYLNKNLGSTTGEIFYIFELEYTK